MKITKKQLRYIIQEMAFDPLKTKVKKAGDHDFSEYSDKEYEDYLKDGFAEPYDRRPYGMLTKDEAEIEKDILRKFHSKHHKEMLKFRDELRKPEGRITALHAPSYEGIATRMKKDLDIKGWIEKYGGHLKGMRDQLSTLMLPYSIYQIGDLLNLNNSEILGYQNAEQVLLETDFAFIVAGYPTITSYEDRMTQTLSALPNELIKHQIGSGISKSTDMPLDITSLDEFISKGEVSEETVLDNWIIKGVHMSIELDELDDFKTYARSLIPAGLNLYVTPYEYDDNWNIKAYKTFKFI